ncbi:MAG: hypothetical protein JO345_30895 [Streptosporangiaceae bacterium]|nr:hypothetical protein [Streptosporangiaceae bacterium]
MNDKAANDKAANDRAVAEQGWGPTLRLSTLVLVRGLARRLATAREGRRGGKAAAAITTLASAAAGGYAKARGWI